MKKKKRQKNAHIRREKEKEFEILSDTIAKLLSFARGLSAKELVDTFTVITGDKLTISGDALMLDEDEILIEISENFWLSLKSGYIIERSFDDNLYRNYNHVHFSPLRPGEKLPSVFYSHRFDYYSERMLERLEKYQKFIDHS